jgi:uncharacterized membrane protein YukC
MKKTVAKTMAITLVVILVLVIASFVVWLAIESTKLEVAIRKEMRDARNECREHGYSELMPIDISSLSARLEFSSDDLFCYKLESNTEIVVPVSGLE